MLNRRSVMVFGTVAAGWAASRAGGAKLNERNDTQFMLDTSVANDALLADAGRLVDRHAMVWTRQLNAPVATVWRLVSSSEGMAKWWLVPPTTFELRVGGAFRHHWENTVGDFRENEYIDFVEPHGPYASTGGMRIEMRGDGDATAFAFLGTWGADATVAQGDMSAQQPGGPGTPWVGVAAGWHHMVDQLRFVIDDRAPRPSYAELTDFYAGYLRDLYRWNRMTARVSG